MNKAQLRAWLKLVGIPVRSERGEWITVSCPLAASRHERGTDRNPSFGFKLQPGESRVYCFSCGYAGTQSDLLYALHREAPLPAYADAQLAIVRAEEQSEIVLEDEPEVDPEYPFPEALWSRLRRAYKHPYLRSRSGGRVPESIARKMDFRWDARRGRLCVPVRDHRGRLMGIHGRAVHPEQKPPYLVYRHRGHSNRHVWLGEHWLDVDQPVVVAESVFDLARALQVWPNSVSPLSATVSARALRRITGAAEIVTLFDPDKAGDAARERLERACKGSYVRHVRLDPKIGDAGDHTVHELADRLDALLQIDRVVRA